ncbi:hypothetical protein SMACR_06082 [Sordaria macrospora]|uniref:WGS project CABT00000000 data, contig 2.32 n=2 Tax=Sordaria macrospora TaxID=5147 RepID=F7W602_SORMK|nr:uncharacterized protein SMAC_06082 [Sordaria macrospora k-hell]KAA8631416.1 hypothetical protein SMACR_06082 [Sordaria macrospora]KAH7628170.1 hypothetical protein B0T09DRAFT_367609 [Sordaria sp. MPI-SDFR-AT-0083]WPJ65625.1 hypothetical protein SMAC4_06082 [Sordaria macrospora]CCC12940.1 unnamed protein product [Sordaria macrospora k-hell]
MDANSFLSPVSALDHHVVDNMFNELVAMGPVDGHSSMATYTSVLQSPKPHDELNRHWFVDFKIAVTHFGVKLPDPLQSPVGDGVTLAQATAASKIHEGYLEGEGFNAPGGPHFVDATSTNIGQPSREENERPNSDIAATEEAHPMLTAQPILGLDIWSLDATITNVKNAGLDEPLKEERGPAPLRLPTHPASTVEPDRAVRGTSRGRNIKRNGVGATVTIANIGQLSRVQQGQASTKRSLDTTDVRKLAPQSKKQQQGFLLRVPTSVLEEEYLPSQARQQSQTPTVAPVPQTPAQAKTRPEFVDKFCGNKDCGKPGHELADCFGPPSNMGDIDGCPFCNTQEHVLDNCPLLPTVTKDQLFDVLVTRRANLPLIRTAISFLNLAAFTKKLDLLAKTMPLQRRTARWAYTELKPILMGKLYENWETLVSGTTRLDRDIKSVPDSITVFKRRWTHELVPYNPVYFAAGINCQYGPKEDLTIVQERHRDMVQERLFCFLKERYEAQPSNSSEKEGVREQEKGK